MSASITLLENGTDLGGHRRPTRLTRMVTKTKRAALSGGPLSFCGVSLGSCCG
jgi:hypothetical protein